MAHPVDMTTTPGTPKPDTTPTDASKHNVTPAGVSNLANPVDLLVAAIPSGRFTAVAGAAFADDATLDATVPNWRFAVRGAARITGELAGWFADEGSFEELSRTPLHDGELLSFTLRWVEGGVPHACHQAHRITVADGASVADKVWCGGRWAAPLLAQMEEAARAS